MIRYLAWNTSEQVSGMEYYWTGGIWHGIPVNRYLVWNTSEQVSGLVSGMENTSEQVSGMEYW